MECKLLPKWSTPQRITSRNLNSYQLETLNGNPIPGVFSTRRLRRFMPQEGTKLAEDQKLVEGRCVEEERKQRRRDKETITKEGQTITLDNSGQGQNTETDGDRVEDQIGSDQEDRA
jgi:hypothetical protein